MKKFLMYLFMFLLSETATFANTPIEEALKSSAHEPNYISVFGALIFVVALIYITGIIYTKLNVVGSKVAKKVKHDFVADKVFILSSMPMSNGKSLHVIEVNDEKLLIGVSQNNISLIKELKKNSKVSFDDFNSFDEQPKTEPVQSSNSKSLKSNLKINDEKIDLVKEGIEDIFNTVEEEPKAEDDTDYGLYKKYL